MDSGCIKYRNIVGSVVCITGGYGSLGQCLAKAFIAEGCAVILTGRQETILQQTAKALGCKAFQLDVTEPEQAEALQIYIKKNYGRLDILINNAAFIEFGKIGEIKPSVFLETIKTNLYGPFLCIQTLLPLLRQSHHPLIINISSTAGHRGHPNMSAYNASKFGLMGFTESIRQELRKENIRVTTLSPSAISFKENPASCKPGRIQGDDVAQTAVLLSKSPGRTLYKDIEIWSTNPEE